MQLSNNSTLLTSYLYYKSTFYSYLYNNKYVSDSTTYYSYLHRVFKTTVAKNYDFDIYNVKTQRKKINQS